MFSFGLFTLFVGYAMAYTAFANLRNGFQGPKLTHSLGLDIVIAPPSGGPKSGSTPGTGRKGGSGNF